MKIKSIEKVIRDIQKNNVYNVKMTKTDAIYRTNKTSYKL